MIKKQGRKRSLDTPKRIIERREREKERERKKGRDKRERERERGKRDRVKGRV